MTFQGQLNCQPTDLPRQLRNVHNCSLLFLCKQQGTTDISFMSLPPMETTDVVGTAFPGTNPLLILSKELTASVHKDVRCYVLFI